MRPNCRISIGTAHMFVEPLSPLYYLYEVTSVSRGLLSRLILDSVHGFRKRVWNGSGCSSSLYAFCAVCGRELLPSAERVVGYGMLVIGEDRHPG
jgi:hypothetical protein